jgi:beta-glucanase (GH16 family)
VLEAVHDPSATTVPGKYYTSARVRTLGKYSIGPSGPNPVIKVEARIKLPGGLGLWPAFWMLPSDGSIAGCSGCGRHGGWPSSGEIDIMEAANAMRSVSREHGVCISTRWQASSLPAVLRLG